MHSYCFSNEQNGVFQVTVGREWYIHAIYTVRSREGAAGGIGKRSVERQHHLVAAAPSGGRRRARRTPSLVWEIGAENGRGTDIQHIALDRTRKTQVPEERVPADSAPPQEPLGPLPEVGLAVVMGGLTVGLLALGLSAIAAALLCRSRGRRKEAPQGSGSSREPMMPPQSGPHSDSSEV